MPWMSGRGTSKGAKAGDGLMDRQQAALLDGEAQAGSGGGTTMARWEVDAEDDAAWLLKDKVKNLREHWRTRFRTCRKWCCTRACTTRRTG